MTNTLNPSVVHNDASGRPLTVGSIILYVGSRASLYCGVIKKLGRNKHGKATISVMSTHNTHPATLTELDTTVIIELQQVPKNCFHRIIKTLEVDND
jgi:hypothetical protein